MVCSFSLSLACLKKPLSSHCKIGWDSLVISGLLSWMDFRVSWWRLRQGWTAFKRKILLFPNWILNCLHDNKQVDCFGSSYGWTLHKIFLTCCESSSTRSQNWCFSEFTVMKCSSFKGKIKIRAILMRVADEGGLTQYRLWIFADSGFKWRPCFY